jgi:DnaJ-class molecular chaperone
MQIEIPDFELEQMCGHCNGDGKSDWDHTWERLPKAATCWQCNGKGYLVTEMGEKILDFLQKHWGR